MSEKVQLQVYFLYLLRRLNHNPKLEKLSGYLCKRIGGLSKLANQMILVS